MREPDPQQEWLTSDRNHASSDYDRDRRRRTWNESHPPAGRARERSERRRRERRRNRAQSRFGKVNWDAYQHDHLYDMIMQAKPEQMYARASEWSALAGRIEDTTGRVQQVVERVMGSWRGQAAVNAAGANTRLLQWAGTASHTAGRIAEKMADYTEAVEAAQRRMPEPVFATAERNFRNGYTVTTNGGPSDAVFLRALLTDGMASHEQARARKAEAVAVMEAYESRSKEVHDSIPQFTDGDTGIEPGAAWTPRPAEVDQGAPPAGGPDGSAGGGSPSGAGGGPGGVPIGGTSTAGFVDPTLGGGPGPGGSGPGGGLGGPGFGGGPGSLNGGGDTLRGGTGAGGGFGAGGFGAGGLAAGGLGAGGAAGRVPGAV
ncbi:WXG100 family type VII secretion target, partial [Actinophytocola xanthii]